VIVFSVMVDREGCRVQADWKPDELIGAWTLVEGDWKLIANKTGVTRLGFAVMLKFYEIEGRFPAYPEEVPRTAVDYIASLVKVDPALFAKYSWRGRTIEYHRAQIRKAYGTRPPTEADEDRWARWLAGEMCPTETSRDRLAAALRQAVPKREGGAADKRPGGAGGGLGLPPVRRGLRRDGGRPARPGGVRQAGRPAGPAECAGGAEVRPGHAGTGHATRGLSKVMRHYLRGLGTSTFLQDAELLVGHSGRYELDYQLRRRSRQLLRGRRLSLAV
jgi:Domain of unknown function (DUF4158)